MNDICCIGHITLDKIVTPRKTTYMPGGTSYYFSHGISHLKDTKHYQLVTALAPSEFKAVEDIRAKGIKVTVIPSHRTVYFENTYGENQDNRSQRVLAKADPFTVEQLRQCHLQRGFKDIGYHFYITRDGELHHCRPISEPGAHVRGFNRHSIGICYEGGLDENGYPADTRTQAQRFTLLDLLTILRHQYPKAQILGHYQLSASIHSKHLIKYTLYFHKIENSISTLVKS